MLAGRHNAPLAAPTWLRRSGRLRSRELQFWLKRRAVQSWVISLKREVRHATRPHRQPSHTFLDTYAPCNSHGVLARLRRVWRSARSLCLDACRPDERPPLFDLGLLQCAERLWRALITCRDLVDEAVAHRGIRPRLARRGIETGDDVSGCVFRYPKAVPDRHACLAEPNAGRFVLRL